MEIINDTLIELNSDLQCKEDVINRIAFLLAENHRISDPIGFKKDIYKREKELSTSMGEGVAIPHTQSKFVQHSSLVLIKLKNKIHWDDDKNISLIFGIAVPYENKDNHHLKILSTLARKLMNDDFRKKLYQLENKQDTMKYLKFLNEIKD
ncbi:fructose-specific phosphotransferase system IIA component [Breznakia sp. PF5-3]|uniref:PTS sugar transporter subunit IIA n=1 Tax=unclassified Breznakia TaxID=2623764 RepID=UPI002405A866|nr:MULTISPECIES: fructose PTS transporter subunit IIA [unclassified Breznakia]MDF9825793.1 fructose-specific phosphotransferase system IIA component [Breznakia sp. PM6-1]MDF9836598.1 fructose-specific phosphotransferase system IIA component [Breznakia sp. PF5-3]MDF9838826.1 fructose-specific phosphotransferase system IIA component [Breznakia sp. PFB2-8]MDF9860861.1 fructose-specific phosphotransferase system IIA component [Breznakia sp. PH5-24]